MANKDQNTGFRPFGKVRAANPYLTGGIVYPGDLVKLDSNGAVVVCAAGNASALGVALSYAASAGTVLVADDPAQLFVCQVDDATVDAQTDINLNYNITVGTASTLYKRSACEIDGNTGVTDSDMPIKILRISPAIDNALGDQVDVVCKINNHALGNITLGV